MLTRGPVHEAFAETVTFDPQPGIVVARAPRDIIEEVPPEQRLEGVNVTWIPGYWAWEDERDDYLWVSGIWRALPPDRQWVPGYWGQSQQGFQWISGYWADATVNETEYLPEPPPTVEVGPNVAAPSPDYGWAPGSWVWHDGRYAWRPGYWVEGRRDWVWVPAHYIWAPRGYVFSEGYWDYSVVRRGVLFAPVYFDAVVYTRADFHYSPSFAINLEVFSDQLFVRPRYQHYYFGDYYAADYRDRGFYASFSVDSRRSGYDPIYAHERWRHREDHEWERRHETAFQHRRDHEDARPVRTLAAQIKSRRTNRDSTDRSLEVVTSLDQMSKRTESPVRLQPVASEERQQLRERRQDVQKFRGERQKLETHASRTSTETPSKTSEPARVKLRRSPIVGRSTDQFDKDQAPPQRPQLPKADPTVERKQRTVAGREESSANRSKGESKEKDKDRDKDKKDDKRKDK